MTLDFASISLHPRWLNVFKEGLKHQPFCIEATAAERCLGILPLCYIRSPIFGKHLVGLPYLNTGGVTGADARPTPRQ